MTDLEFYDGLKEAIIYIILLRVGTFVVVERVLNVLILYEDPYIQIKENVISDTRVFMRKT